MAGAVVGIILATSASDTQDATSDITAQGAAAVYLEDCAYAGRTLAVINELDEGSGTGTAVADTVTALTALHVGENGFFGNLRLAADLSESRHNADFNGDNDTEDTIGRTATVGLLARPFATPTVIDRDANLLFVPQNQWRQLRIDVSGNAAADAAAGVAASNRVQLFVNSADNCWGLRRI